MTTNTDDRRQDDPSLPNTVEKIQQIILNELDTEIFLKTAQLRQIRQELTKGEQILAHLKHLLSKKESQQTAIIPPTVLPNSPTKSDQKYLFEWTVSGKCVRLRCPECHKDGFLNLLGFSNHCRIVHGIVFLTPEDRIQRCGIEVEEDEIPADVVSAASTHHYFNKSLAQLRVELNKNLPDHKPTIAVDNLIPLSLELDSNAKERSFVMMDLQPSLESSLLLADELKEPTGEEVEMETESENNSKVSFNSDQLIETQSVMLQPQSDSHSSLELPSESFTMPSESFTMPNESFTIPNESSTIPESLSQLYSSQSRFYLKKRITIGNLVKTVYDEKTKKQAYRWRLYIRDPSVNCSTNTLDRFVKKVRYHLHSSYEPETLVECEEYPFLLTKIGWGEFVVKIELEIEGKRSPIEIFFPLKLKPGRHSARYVVGNERSYELEIDRNSTTFSLEQTELFSLPYNRTKNTSLSDPEKTDEFKAGVGESQKYSRYCKYCGISFGQQRTLDNHCKSCELKFEAEHVNSFSPFPSFNSTKNGSIELAKPNISTEHQTNSPSDDFDSTNANRLNGLQCNNDLSLHNTTPFSLLSQTITKEMNRHLQPINSNASYLLGSVAEKFTRDLIQKAVSNLRDNSPSITVSKATNTSGKEISTSTSSSEQQRSLPKRILTPIHFYNAIIGDDKMDFLTNKYLLKQ